MKLDKVCFCLRFCFVWASAGLMIRSVMARSDFEFLVRIRRSAAEMFADLDVMGFTSCCYMRFKIVLEVLDLKVPPVRVFHLCFIIMSTGTGIFCFGLLF